MAKRKLILGAMPNKSIDLGTFHYMWAKIQLKDERRIGKSERLIKRYKRKMDYWLHVLYSLGIVSIKQIAVPKHLVGKTTPKMIAAKAYVDMLDQAYAKKWMAGALKRAERKAARKARK